MEVSIYSVIPFILLLLSIALFPFINRRWWGKNYPFVSITLAVIIIIYYISLGKSPELFYAAEEYIMFISLLASLFIISGGILIELKGLSTPIRNVFLLASGAVLANLIGTTGASMLLIRPYIKTNKIRISPFHIVFFIFIVSNIGGALTPIGDPPLFLGFLKGIPFFWIGEKVILRWVITIGLLLIIFYLFDLNSFKKQPEELEKKEIEAKEKLVFKGWINVLLMIIVICSVFIAKPLFLREAIMLLTALVSYKITNKDIHHGNYFNFHPIKEVAWLFIGIFITMIPALELLQLHSKNLGLTTPSQYYWFTGLLSAFLDNAPTYLTFLTASMGLYSLDINNVQDVLNFISVHQAHVVAISVSSVFFGALTYIGNGPNFMVKSVADQHGIKTPGFLGYLFKYSLPILIPIYALIWWLFVL